MINFDHIQHAIFVGSCPRRGVDVERLRRGLGITAILNLQTDSDFRALDIDWQHLQASYRTHDVVVHRFPIRDFDPDHLQQRVCGAAAALQALHSADHRVYVHCTAGVCRAPAVVIGFMTWHQGWDLDAAHQFVTGQRACSPYLERIRAAGTALEL